MAASDKREWRQLLADYISRRRDVNKLKEFLKNKPVTTRYDLLTSVRGDTAWTGVHRATEDNDVEMVRCMLAEFTPEQTYNVLKLQTSHGNVPLHVAAYYGSAEVMKYLLSCVNQQPRFNLLMTKGWLGHTVLHKALAYNQRDTAELILSTLSLQQQLHLMNVKDRDNKSVADLYPDFLLPVEIAAKGHADLKSTMDEQATVIAEQKREIAEQKRKIGEQEREMVTFSEKIQNFEDKQTELEEKLSALEMFIRQPVVLGDEDNHEHVPDT